MGLHLQKGTTWPEDEDQRYSCCPCNITFTATDSQVHRYSSAGRFDLKLTVRDDDGGANDALVLTSIV